MAILKREIPDRLDDLIDILDNHKAYLRPEFFGKMSNAITTLKLEIEGWTIGTLKDAIEANPNVIMLLTYTTLDNIVHVEGQLYRSGNLQLSANETVAWK